MMKKLLLASAVAVAFGAAGSTARAGILGDTFQINYDFPGLGSSIESTTFTPFVAGDSVLVEFGIDTITFYDNAIVISMDPGCGTGCSQNGGAFNGIVISNLTNPLVSATLGSSNFSGYTLTFVGGEIQYDQQGLDVVPGHFLTIDVATAAPEPASMALLGAGIAGLGFARRRKAS